LGRVGRLEKSGKDSKSEDDVFILVQADVLVHDVEEVIDVASVGDSGDQTFVASDFFKLNLLISKASDDAVGEIDGRGILSLEVKVNG